MECGPKCKSRRHALEINSALTKASLEEFQTYCKLCFSATHVSDIYGRSSLHVAASCGKCDVIEWLMTERNGDVSQKDAESGWTALHRAAFYGQLAASRLLIQFNSDLYSRDNEGLSPLDLFMKNIPPNVSFTDTDSNDVFSWGDNSNFTLGHSNEQRRNYPERVEFFRNNFNIKDIVMCKYHSVFLSKTGQVFTCGHGHGGRLGHGDEQTYLVPRQIESLKNEVCVQIAASRDHSLFLLESGVVYSCGLNDNNQLGQSTKKSLVPKPINGKIFKGKDIKGICCGRFHSVMYTDQAVYTCGLNAGQLGHPKGQDRLCPLRQVSSLNHKDIVLERVECSDAAVVCLTSLGDIYVLHEYQCRKIASKWQDIVKIDLSGGNLDHNSDIDVLREKGGSELTIILQHNQPGKVFIWRSSSPILKRCRWAIKRQLQIQDVCLSASSITIVTDKGEAFLGTLNPKKSSPKDIARQNSSTEATDDSFGKMRLIDLLLKDEAEDVLLRRLPNIHRGTRIYCDRKGRNYAVLQSQSNLCVTDVPSVSESTMIEDIKDLMEEAEEFDMIHDVVIKIHGHSWIAHRYILVSRCDYFHKLVAESLKRTDSETAVIEINDVHPEIFDQLIQFIYTDTCDLLTPGSKFELTKMSHDNGIDDHDIGDFNTLSHKTSAYEALKKKKGQSGKKEDKSSKSTNPVKMLQELAKRFGIRGLPKRLDAVRYNGGKIEMVPNKVLAQPTVSFDRHREKDLYDVCIQSEDGKQFMCHKCILVARLEYFNSMLSCGWVETSNTKSLTLPVTSEILEILLDYIYTDKSSIILESDNVELLCNVLVVADQMLVIRLKEMCETSISQLVSFKNVAELLEFSSLYNATQLKATCQQYIHINMAALFEGRYLDVLSDDVIDELRSYYRDHVPAMCRRIITPWDEGPDKAYLEELVQGPKMADNTETPSKKNKSKKRRSRNKSLSDDLERSRQRQISISSDISIKSDEDLMEMEVNDSPRDNKKEKMVVDSSSRSTPISINLSTTSPKKGPPPVSPSHNRMWPMSPKSEGTNQGMDLRRIMEEENKDRERNSVVPPQKRFSWKEVKKQQNKAREQNNNNIVSQADDVNMNNSVDQQPVKPVCPWGDVNKVTKSFRDLMMEDKSSTKTTQKSLLQPSNSEMNSMPAAQLSASPMDKRSPVPPSSNPKDKRSTLVVNTSSNVKATTKSTSLPTKSNNLFSWGLPTSSVQKKRESVSEEPVESPTSPSEIVNPWQQKQEAGAYSFTEIVNDEKQKQETFTRTTNKPLGLIQIEEKAIQELLQYYKASAAVDERITVERVPQAMATPVWTAKRQKQPHS